MKAFIVVYFILMFPMVIQTHNLMKRGIDERIRNSFKYNIRVFIRLIIYMPRWWWLFFIDKIDKFKNK